MVKGPSAISTCKSLLPVVKLCRSEVSKLFLAFCFINNFVLQAAGSERAGFRVPGETCDKAAWQNNRVHSSMFGVMMWEGDEISKQCFQINGTFIKFMFKIIKLINPRKLIEDKIMIRDRFYAQIDLDLSFFFK